MNLNSVGGARKMHWAYIVLTLLLTCTVGSTLDDYHCQYFYNHGCGTRGQTTGLEYRQARSHRSCWIDNVSDDIKYHKLLSKDGSTSSGLVKVTFTLPNVECNYEVALLVNSSITNKEDCKNYVFNTESSYEEEIHTIERTVCVVPSINETAASECEKNGAFQMWYEHVFTGCYALRFTVDGYTRLIRGNRYLEMDYNRTEAAEPKFRCYDEDIPYDESSKELVTFTLSVSVLSGTVGMVLALTPLYLDEIKENACVLNNHPALYTWEISTDEAAPALKNCSLTKIQFNNDTYSKDLECVFALQVPHNSSYCFEITLHDERCSRGTIWNPPQEILRDTRERPPCTWLQKCEKIPKDTSAIEYNVMVGGSKQMNSDNILLLPIAITVILIILIVSGTVLFVYRLHSRHTRQSVYMSTNLRDFKITASPAQTDSVETTDDETYKGSNNGDECDGIVLLYARGSPTFMSFMTDFREILKIHCGCHVRDWYAASEWDAVARVGPATWVAELLKQKHRAVWMDTPRARALLDTQWKNNIGHLIELKRPYDHSLDEDAISDFRDIALQSVLDTAKRTVGPEPAIQYSKHFVVRLEGFEVVNRREDPFEDLSPHARYLVPYHLNELCTHLSSWRTNLNNERLKTDEGQLRERLISMKTNAS